MQISAFINMFYNMFFLFSLLTTEVTSMRKTFSQ